MAWAYEVVIVVVVAGFVGAFFLAFAATYTNPKF